jgi:hypothetical protein
MESQILRTHNRLRSAQTLWLHTNVAWLALGLNRLEQLGAFWKTPWALIQVHRAHKAELDRVRVDGSDVVVYLQDVLGLELVPVRRGRRAPVAVPLDQDLGGPA